MARRARRSDQRRDNPRPRPLWLELRGQQRLQRLHARMQLRRQVLQRWQTVVDSVDEKVLDRLDDLGGGEPGYDAAGRDVTGRFRAGEQDEGE